MTSNNDLLSSLNKIFIKIVKDGNVELVEDFIKLGVDVNRNEVHYWASRNGHLAVVECLITNGIDIQYDDNFLLRNAAFYGSLNIVEYLIKNGADIHAENDYAVRHASCNGHLTVVECLIKNGADIRDNDDYALRYASENGHTDVVELLNNHIKNEKKESKSKEIEELQKQVLDIQNKLNAFIKTQ
jgi:ankyrin repeat protein